MTPNNAKNINLPQAKKRIVFVVYDGIKMLDLIGPLQVFNDAAQIAGHDCYECCVASLEGGDVQTDIGICVASAKIEDVIDREIDLVLVVGGDGSRVKSGNFKFISAVIALCEQANRFGSICTGIRILAAAGLLDGKSAVTHWAACDEVVRNYPSVNIQRDAIYVQDRNIWTSAGVTSGIDMALAILCQDFGRDIAIRLAQELVTYFVRPGGQSQFSNLLSAQSKDNLGKFDKLHGWVSQNISKNISVETMSDFCGMSPRTFARQYKKSTGVSPAKSVEIMRVEAAGSLLQEGNLNNKIIANVCGFLNYEQMRRAFMRHLFVSPVAYREKYKIL